MTKYYLTDLLSQDELMHYGIKGQKWGRRRFQYEDGSLTPAGKERYDDDGPSERKKKEYKIPEKKSTHRLKIEEKYKTKGMSEKEAEQAAAKRIRGEQYALAAAAVTVAACIAYNKYKNYNVDKTLSSNTEFQRIVTAKSADAPVRKGAKYVSYDKKDNMKYQGLWGDTLNKQKQAGEQVYKMSIKGNKDIKIASDKRARETFEKLYNEDEVFRRTMKSRVYDNQMIYNNDKTFAKTASKIMKGEQMSSKETKQKAYDIFNQMLTDQNPRGRANADKFYNELKKQGMDAIQDINDKKYSGFNAKNPLILFDGDYDYKKVAMTNEEIKKMNAKATTEILKPTAIKAGVAYVGIFGSGPLVDNRALDRETILYKREHPNTKMSDK